MASLKQLINQTCGNNIKFLSLAYKGLHEETALKGFKPYLDLDEILMFSAISWIKRKNEYNRFNSIIQNNDISEIFNYVLKEGGYGFLYNNKNITLENKKLEEKYNPYHGKNLKDRLMQVDQELDLRLEKQLSNKTHIYCFNEKDYYNKKSQQFGSNERLEILPLKRVYTPKEKMPEEYTRLIHDIIKDFSK